MIFWAMPSVKCELPGHQRYGKLSGSVRRQMQPALDAPGEAAMSTLELSDQESQLIEILREWSGKDAYEMRIERHDGAWEISLKELGTKLRARGVGVSFDAAWDGITLTGPRRL
jgi:hypothetical protein